MPVVPVLNENQVQRRPMTDAKFAAPDFGEAGERLGLAARRAGAALSDAAEGLDDINAVYDEAAAKKLDNEAAERIAQMLWTGDDAFYRKQGFDAGDARPTVEKSLKDLRAELISKAKTERQRNMFSAVFDRRVAQESEGIARHTIAETSKEETRQSIARGIIARDEAIRFGDDPTRRDTALLTGLGEIRSRASKEGWSPDVLKAEEQKYTSDVYGGIIDGKMRADPVTANALADQWRDKLTPETYQKVKDTLYPAMQERQAVADIDAYQGVATDALPEVPKPQPGQAPTLARMVSITAFAESGGRERNADGSRVTSPKGAQGIMQVMPATQRDPGFGIKPSNGTPEDDARVGREYLAAMMKRYGGDPAKAWAAYNAGPGRVDAAVAKHSEGWIRGMPAETKAYVASNTAALGDGAGRYQPRQDDLAGIYKWIDAQPWDFDRKQAAREEADRRVARNDMLLRRQEEAAHDQALGIVDGLGEGFTSITQLPPALQRQLSPEARQQFTQLAKQNAAPKPRQTDYGFYLGLSDTFARDKAAFLRISPAQARVSLSDGDFETYMGWRRDALGGGAAKTPKQVEHSRILSVTSDALGADGIITGDSKEARDPKNLQRRALFVSQMSERVREWQAVNPGKEPSDDDLKRMAGNLLLDVTGTGGKNVFEASDAEIAAGISANDRKRIVLALQRQGVPTTEANIGNFYRRLGAFGRAERVR